MKGIILAGGSGTRLQPNTKVTNKHLLPVYNQPMIYYPLQTLLKAGITDILIMPGKEHAGDFAKLLGSGKDFNANFSFKIQDHAGGLAYAVSLAEEFVGEDNFVVMLGDNIVEDNIVEDVVNFKSGAKIFLKQVKDPERFGVAELDGVNVLKIEEKPKNPKSSWAAVGVYIFDYHAFEYIKTLKPSARGELEITDLNNIYVQKKTMQAGFLKGFWFDTGTHESLVDAAYSIKNFHKPLDPLRLEQKIAPKVVIGGILYNEITAQYLADFIPSISAQDYSNKELILIDNSEEIENNNIRFLRENYPQIKVIRSDRNVGFARAYNLLIAQALEMKAQYFFCTNIDMFYETNVLSELVNTIMKTPQIASATCKIKIWNFDNKNDKHFGKTNFIDTTGIVMTNEHRFYDRGQGEIDYGQYDQSQEIFGPSGAAALYRLSALEDVAFTNEDGTKEYFDELMFIYKEDVDLAYRLQLAGYKSLYSPEATIYHDRTLKSNGQGILQTVRGRLNRERKYKEWSWLNHHIILQKNFSQSSGKVKWKTFLYELKSNFYVLLFEPYLLKQLWHLWRLRDKIKERRKQIRKRVDLIVN